MRKYSFAPPLPNMTYQEALDFLYSQLPMYSRIGKAAYKEDLTNTLQLCQLLDHPEKKFKSIHIAGTNGKGSTSHMLAAILQTAGYKTGLYTSPHMKDFRERIRINGEMISEAEVIEFVAKYKDEVMKIGCSFFEWTVGLAFQHFSKHKVDIVVIETGMGGRLDSTNVITPLLSIITNISWDHADILGDTIEKIATEKAGIIKQNAPVVIGEKNSNESVNAIFRSKAEELHSAIVFADDSIDCVQAMVKDSRQLLFLETKKNHARSVVQLDLIGNYQSHNAITVLQATVILHSIGWNIDAADINEGLMNTKKITGLQGRWDVLQQNPTVIADVAHNEAGLKCAMENLNRYKYDQLRMVLGFVQEKDLQKILPLFPKDALYYFCAPNIPRGLDAAVLKKEANTIGLQGKSYSSVHAALNAALNEAADNDLIYVGGSTFVVAEIIS